jgi:hypothetical protein
VVASSYSLPCSRKTEGFLLIRSTGAGQFLLVLVLFAPAVQGRFCLGFQGARAVAG